MFREIDGEDNREKWERRERELRAWERESEGGFTGEERKERERRRDSDELLRREQEQEEDRGGHENGDHPLRRDPAERFYYMECAGAVCAAVKWLCIAHLLQLVVAETIPKGEKKRPIHPSSTSNSAPSSSASSSSFSPSRPSNEDKGEEDEEELTNDTILNEWVIGRLCREFLDIIDENLLDPSPLREGSLIQVLTQYCVFLRVVAHTLQVCRPDILTEICPAKHKLPVSRALCLVCPPVFRPSDHCHSSSLLIYCVC
jgi:hypothetical protein